MNKNTWLKILFVTALSLLFLYTLIEKSEDIFKWVNHHLAKLDQHFEFAGVERIEINTQQVNVFIKATPQKKGLVSYNAKTIQVKKIKSKLIIEDGAQPSQSALEIAVPTHLKSLRITTSHDVDIEGLQLSDLSIKAEDGDITLNRMKLGNVSIAAFAGDVNILNSEANNVSIKTVSGDLSYRGNLQHGDFETGSGDVSCRLLNFNGKVRAISGSGSIRVPEDNNGSDLLEVKTINGDIRIRR